LSIDTLRTSTLVEDKLGLEFSTWQRFFDVAPTRDVLDLVTVAYRHLARLPRSAYAVRWRNGVERIFIEEKVHYRVDGKGGVHFHADQEFAHVTVAAISALQPQRYANSRDAFEKGLAALRDAVPDGKGGIRGTFTAIEGLFALMFPGVKQLTSGEMSRLRSIN
jgi:hypothetical protein